MARLAFFGPFHKYSSVKKITQNSSNKNHGFGKIGIKINKYNWRLMVWNWNAVFVISKKPDRNVGNCILTKYLNRPDKMTFDKNVNNGTFEK